MGWLAYFAACILLLQAGLDPLQANDLGQTALHLCAASKSGAALLMLINAVNTLALPPSLPPASSSSRLHLPLRASSYLHRQPTVTTAVCPRGDNCDRLFTLTSSASSERPASANDVDTVCSPPLHSPVDIILQRWIRSPRAYDESWGHALYALLTSPVYEEENSGRLHIVGLQTPLSDALCACHLVAGQGRTPTSSWPLRIFRELLARAVIVEPHANDMAARSHLQPHCSRFLGVPTPLLHRLVTESAHDFLHALLTADPFRSHPFISLPTDANVRNDRGQTALFFASSPRVARLLLAHRADVNAWVPYDGTAVLPHHLFALSRDSSSIYPLALPYERVDWSAADHEGAAADWDHLCGLRTALDPYAHPQQPPSPPPLPLSVLCGRLLGRMMQLLLESGALIEHGQALVRTELVKQLEIGEISVTQRNLLLICLFF